jgi:hypothetical protein
MSGGFGLSQNLVKGKFHSPNWLLPLDVAGAMGPAFLWLGGIFGFEYWVLPPPLEVLSKCETIIIKLNKKICLLPGNVRCQLHSKQHFSNCCCYFCYLCFCLWFILFNHYYCVCSFFSLLCFIFFFLRFSLQLSFWVSYALHIILAACNMVFCPP